MTTRRYLACLAGLSLSGVAAYCMPLSTSQSLAWKPLPAIPDALGFAGSFAGRSENALLVAGGANFPGKPPWEGGTKIWHDRLFVLEDGATAWREAGRLPKPNGYGASLSLGDAVVLIGGGDATQNFPSVWRTLWDGKVVTFTSLPDLPRPLAMHSAANLGNTIYVAGGLTRPDATAAEAGLFALDLANPAAGWRELEPCPGGARFLAVAGAHDGSFYIFGGARLVPDAAGKPQREWLRDAWRYTPGQGWKRLADLPRASVAAPSPAAVASGRLLVVGGDDGAQLKTLPADHRGFPRDILAYDPATDTWSHRGEVPFSLVTTPAILWPGHIVVPGGEKRPGIRSTEVWSAQLP
jgi:N-acetylneuraminic acid mutarotase